MNRLDATHGWFTSPARTRGKPPGTSLTRLEVAILATVVATAISLGREPQENSVPATQAPLRAPAPTAIRPSQETPLITLTDEQFKRFQALIYKHSGIRLDDRKQTLLRSRLQRRLRQIDMDDVDEYYRIVTTPRRKDELQALIDVVTTNETSFYRTETHFQWFSDIFLTEAIRDAKKGQRTKVLRVWSAACSVGAEPYTFLFCLHEKRAAMDSWEINILAADLSTDSLAKAQSGRFTKRLIDGLDAKQTKRFFREIEGFQPEYQIPDEFAMTSSRRCWF